MKIRFKFEIDGKCVFFQSKKTGYALLTTSFSMIASAL